MYNPSDCYCILLNDLTTTRTFHILSVSTRSNGPISNNSPFCAQVSTEDLITNVGVQQQHMMVLMNQQHNKDTTHEQTREKPARVQEELCQRQISAAQNWEQQQIDVQAWQQQQEKTVAKVQQEIEHWIAKRGDEKEAEPTKTDDFVVDVDSQGSHYSGPLDLSSTEVTIVAIDQNTPFTLATVVQDDDRSEF